MRVPLPVNPLSSPKPLPSQGYFQLLGQLSFTSSLSHVLVINTDKSCLIFLEAQLEPEVWPASQGPFLEEEDQSSLSVGYSSLSDSASHPDIRSSSGNSHPLDLLKPASPLLVGLLMPFMQKHSPHVVERLRAAQSGVFLRCLSEKQSTPGIGRVLPAMPCGVPRPTLATTDVRLNLALVSCA